MLWAVELQALLLMLTKERQSVYQNMQPRLRILFVILLLSFQLPHLAFAGCSRERTSQTCLRLIQSLSSQGLRIIRQTLPGFTHTAPPIEITHVLVQDQGPSTGANLAIDAALALEPDDLTIKDLPDQERAQLGLAETPSPVPLKSLRQIFNLNQGRLESRWQQTQEIAKTYKGDADPFRLPLFQPNGEPTFELNSKNQPSREQQQLMTQWMLGDAEVLGLKAPRYRFALTLVRMMGQGSASYLIQHHLIGFSEPVSAGVALGVATLSGIYMFLNKPLYDFLSLKGVISWNSAEIYRSDFKNPLSILVNLTGSLAQKFLRFGLYAADKTNTRDYLKLMDRTRGNTNQETLVAELKSQAAQEWGDAAPVILKWLEALHSSVRLRVTTEMTRETSPTWDLQFLYDWTNKRKNQQASYPEFLAKFITLENLGFLAPIKAVKHSAEWLAKEPLTFHLADFITDATKGATLSALSQGSWDNLIARWRNQEMEKVMSRQDFSDDRKAFEIKKIYMFSDVFAGVNSIANMSLAVPVAMSGSSAAAALLIAAGSPALAASAKIHFGSFKNLTEEGLKKMAALADSQDVFTKTFLTDLDPNLKSRLKTAAEVAQSVSLQKFGTSGEQMDLFKDYGSEKSNQLTKTFVESSCKPLFVAP